MKRVYIVSLISLLLLTACSASTQQPVPSPSTSRDASANPQAAAATDKTPLVIWTTGELYESATAFERDEGAVVMIRNVDKDLFFAVLDGLAEGDGPDLLLVDSGLLGQLSALSIFEDFRSPDYHLDGVREAFPGLDLDRYLSLDGQRIYAVPRDIQAAVTFYRADIFKAHGIPDDPDTLGKLLEDPEQWLNIAKKLKEDNIYLLQWPNEWMDILSMSGPFYNRDGTFARSSSLHKQALSLAQNVVRQDLALNKSIWEPSGMESLRNGELAMLYYGEWAQFSLREWVPDTAHLWRMTRLPLNLYGENGGSSFVIPKQSRNKKLAWQFIEYVIKADTSYRESMQSFRMYDKLSSRVDLPFDGELSKLWREDTDISIYSFIPASDSLVGLEHKLERRYYEQLKTYRDSIRSRE
jgi:multiple sugar transport system substrate-binding protein